MRTPSRRPAHSVLFVDTPLVTPDRAERVHLASCDCGTFLPEGTDRLCTGVAAFHHSARVEDQANRLLNRLRAVVLMGTLDGELKPLYV